jgi:hypothetical protein
MSIWDENLRAGEIDPSTGHILRGSSRGITAFQTLVIVTIMLAAAFSATAALPPVSGYVNGLTVAPNNVTATSGTTTQAIGFAVSTTYVGCWIVCEATWFVAEGAAPFVEASATTTGCSMANYNTFLWSGTCTVTIFLYVNQGGVTPPGTYHPVFWVYTYMPTHRTTIITLTVT